MNKMTQSNQTPVRKSLDLKLVEQNTRKKYTIFQYPSCKNIRARQQIYIHIFDKFLKTRAENCKRYIF